MKIPRIKEVISQQEIATRIKQLGAQISHDYVDKQLVVLAILNGAFIFAADLVRVIHLPLEIDFIRLASYGDESKTFGKVKLTKDVELPLAGKDVLIVEDIVDSGHTINFLLDFLEKRQPNSVQVCALIDKRERRTIEVPVHYAGFELHAGFLIGYGLDFAEKHRNYPNIYSLLEAEEVKCEKQ